MSIHVLSHVMKYSEAKLGARLVLFVLAEHAHDDGTEARPAVATIVERSRLTRRAVQTALRRLERDGEIRADGVGPKGETRWIVCMKGGVDSAPPATGADSARGGEVDDPGGRSSRHERGVAATPKPTTNPSEDPGGESSTGSTRKVPLPDGFPEELRPHLRAVFVILRDFAGRHGAREVNPTALAHAVMANPKRHYVTEAHNYCSNWETKTPKDVVAGYRRWLGNAERMAAPERLDDDGSVIGGLPPGVTPMRRGRQMDNAGDRSRFDRGTG